MIVKHKADQDITKRVESYRPMQVTQEIVDQHIYDHLQVNVLMAMSKGIDELQRAHENMQNFMTLIEEYHQKKASLTELAQRLEHLIADATQEKNDIEKSFH